MLRGVFSRSIYAKKKEKWPPVPSSGSVLGLNSTKAFGFSVEGWCALKKEFALCPSRKSSLRNAIYGNSSEFSNDVITTPH